jgi:hypothetical protein
VADQLGHGIVSRSVQIEANDVPQRLHFTDKSGSKTASPVSDKLSPTAIMRERTALTSMLGWITLLACSGSAKAVDTGADGGADSAMGGGAMGGGAMGGGASAGGTVPVPSTSCAALPSSGGMVVNIAPAEAATLPERTLSATIGTTFVLAPGTYSIAEPLRLERANLTLRSSTDRAADVIIDAAYTVAEAVVILLSPTLRAISTPVASSARRSC